MKEKKREKKTLNAIKILTFLRLRRRGIHHHRLDRNYYLHRMLT